MRKKKAKLSEGAHLSAGTPGELKLAAEALAWTRARYHFHTFAYRDPRSVFSSAMGLPVVSPTAVVLGIASTLFSLGEAEMAQRFMKKAHLCQVIVDPPEGMIFFRAFHQIRRYATDKYRKTKGPNPRMGLTDINQGTREYALVGGEMAIYVGTPVSLKTSVALALRNRDHLGTHDSMCSLVDVKECSEPQGVVFQPLDGKTMKLPSETGVTVVTLARFREDRQLQPSVGQHWWLAGGDDTELIPYLIKGNFRGTSRGKIYRKY